MRVKSPVKNHLDFLYGQSAATGVEEAVQDLIRKACGARPAKSSVKDKPTEADSMLITYGDQVHASNESPLKTLDEVSRNPGGWRDQRRACFAVLPEFIG